MVAFGGWSAYTRLCRQNRQRTALRTLDAVTDGSHPQQEPASHGPRFLDWMGSLWGYTLLRFGMFFALWGILVLVGLGGLLAPLIALVISVPLSYVLLSGPRNRVAHNIEARIAASRHARADLDARLDPNQDEDD